MSSKNRNLTLVGAVVVASAGAFVAGRMSAPADGRATAAGEKALPGKASSRIAGSDDTAGAAGKGRTLADRTGAKAGAARGEDAMAKMEALMRTVDPMERNKAWMDFINSIDPSEFGSVVASFRSLGMTESRMTEYAMLLSA